MSRPSSFVHVIGAEPLIAMASARARFVDGRLDRARFRAYLAKRLGDCPPLAVATALLTAFQECITAQKRCCRGRLNRRKRSAPSEPTCKYGLFPPRA